MPSDHFIPGGHHCTAAFALHKITYVGITFTAVDIVISHTRSGENAIQVYLTEDTPRSLTWFLESYLQTHVGLQDRVLRTTSCIKNNEANCATNSGRAWRQPRAVILENSTKWRGRARVQASHHAVGRDVFGLQHSLRPRSCPASQTHRCGNTLTYLEMVLYSNPSASKIPGGVITSA